MGVPYFQIKDTLREMGRFVFLHILLLYRDVSRRVFDVVTESYPNLEQYSIDECFFALSDDITKEQLSLLKRQVEKRVGIPVSIGVAASKTRAKYANTIAKKDK